MIEVPPSMMSPSATTGSVMLPAVMLKYVMFSAWKDWGRQPTGLSKIDPALSAAARYSSIAASIFKSIVTSCSIIAPMWNSSVTRSLVEAATVSPRVLGHNSSFISNSTLNFSSLTTFSMVKSSMGFNTLARVKVFRPPMLRPVSCRWCFVNLSVPFMRVMSISLMYTSPADELDATLSMMSLSLMSSLVTGYPFMGSPLSSFS
mmetsp:Transcript_4303/g.8023  ORF Transcript_4303/g.8023 Transcript_4303/m.8023 type:complete len:204 (-) Transcript_4303:2080-2691(-)